MRRNILLVTTDQQRFDALGCNGGEIARTPVVDRLAATGRNYQRAHPQNVVCMPSRATIITGQYVGTHGVWMNGAALPVDAPNVARHLHQHGYETALVGKSHFEPFMAPGFVENELATLGSFGPHRGFDHMEMATHTPLGGLHYARWMHEQHADHIGGFYPVLDSDLQVNARGGGRSGAPQVAVNPVPREVYHTDWVAERTVAWLADRDDDSDWFCWMSFPDPHHPWDPPEAETARVPWRDVPLPAGYPVDRTERQAILDQKPRHWRAWYDGTLVTNYEAPARWIPSTLTEDQIREVNAMTHVENELIDEGLGRVIHAIEQRGWRDRTDIIYTTDHGEFQGDFGLLFKGPYHVDSLMRLPLIWSPAPGAGGAPARITAPVGHVDLAPTFCEIADVPTPDWMEGKVLPFDDDDAAARGHERVLTEWDSEHTAGGVSLRSICRDGWLCTNYGPGVLHDGTEGELYSLVDDPLQHTNRWDDATVSSRRDDLLADLRDNLPPRTARHPVVASV